jgi:hypothetical protein
MKKLIVKQDRRPTNHSGSARLILTLECGHTVKRPASQVSRRQTFVQCKECDAALDHFIATRETR